MYALSIATFVLLSAAVTAPAVGYVVPRKETPSTYAVGYLEDYQTYHTRYLAIGCQYQHNNATFFNACCHPMLVCLSLIFFFPSDSNTTTQRQQKLLRLLVHLTAFPRLLLPLLQVPRRRHPRRQLLLMETTTMTTMMMIPTTVMMAMMTNQLLPLLFQRPFSLRVKLSRQRPHPLFLSPPLLRNLLPLPLPLLPQLRRPLQLRLPALRRLPPDLLIPRPALPRFSPADSKFPNGTSHRPLMHCTFAVPHISLRTGIGLLGPDCLPGTDYICSVAGACGTVHSDNDFIVSCRLSCPLCSHSYLFVSQVALGSHFTMFWSLRALDLTTYPDQDRYGDSGETSQYCGKTVTITGLGKVIAVFPLP